MPSTTTTSTAGDIIEDEISGFNFRKSTTPPIVYTAAIPYKMIIVPTALNETYLITDRTDSIRLSATRSTKLETDINSRDKNTAKKSLQYDTVEQPYATKHNAE
jgi:hypothetical protein